MSKEFCEAVLRAVNSTVESGITSVLKIEQDRSYSTIDVDSVRFSTAAGATVQIVLTFPKVMHVETRLDD